MKKLRFGILLLISTFLLISSKFYPALGMGEDHTNQGSLNGAMYTFHAGNQVGELLPESTCHICHPGPQSESLREVLAAMDIGCTVCHAGMTSMESPQHIRGVGLLTCISCHNQDSTKADITSLGKLNIDATGELQPTQIHVQDDNYVTCENCHPTHLQEAFWHFASAE